MYLSFVLKLLTNQWLCIKHIIYSLLKCRLFRRYWIYFLMSFIILLIQIIICITFYSSNNLSIESKIQSQFNTIEKFRKINERVVQSFDYVLETNINNPFNSHSRDLSQNNYLKSYFKEVNVQPICNITVQNGRYGLSAIQRAVTRECKQKLAEITCLSISSQLYPQSLPRYCPLRDGNFGDYLGCYKDRTKSRLLSTFRSIYADNSPEKCLNICLQSGFSYAGLEFGNECYCGSELSSHKLKLESNVCNISCSGAPGLMCGGYYAIDIYKTGLKFMPKVIPSLDSNNISDNGVKIVFLLTLNGRSVRQIKRLFKKLYDRKHYYFIHIDSRQDYLFRELSQLETKLSNVRLSRERLSTIWGGASLLQMLLSSISQILNYNKWENNWDFVINLSETDFPLKSIRDLETFLAAHKGKNFVKSHGQDSQRFITKQGLDRTFYECDTHMWRVADRHLPKGIRWDGGSDWIVLSHQFSKYVTFEDNLLLKGLKQLFKYTLLPAESFFHTVLQNSEFCATIVDSNLRLTNWRRKQGCKCQYKHIVDWCGCSPNDFKTNDWTRLLATQTKPIFFGRKFEPIVNQNIINRLEEMIEKSFDKNMKSLDNYWENEYHFRDSQSTTSDAKLTFYYTFAINSQKSIEKKCEFNDNLSQTKSLHLSHVKEVNLYLKDDVFEGILITFESMANDGINSVLSFETMIRPMNNNIINDFSEKLMDLKVCSEFDVKELLFRNFGCILGPFTKPVALHKWFPIREPLVMTFVWVDPINTVAASYEVKIESNGTTDQSFDILTHKPQLNTPLRPGVWKLLVLHKWVKIAETKFLVTPLVFYNKTKLNKENAKHLHNGPKHSYTSHNFSSIQRFLFGSNSPDIGSGMKNSYKSGEHLLNWINNLYSHFWFIQEMCYISDKTSFGIDFNCDLNLIPCHLTDWSSHSPDPKSDISELI